MDEGLTTGFDLKLSINKQGSSSRFEPTKKELRNLGIVIDGDAEKTGGYPLDTALLE